MNFHVADKPSIRFGLECGTRLRDVFTRGVKFSKSPKYTHEPTGKSSYSVSFGPIMVMWGYEMWFSFD